MQKQVNNYGNDQRTVQQQSLDGALLADQNQGSWTDFFKPAQPGYIVNEQDQEEFVNEFLNEDDDFLSGHRENPGSIAEGGEDENEDDEEDADENTKRMPKGKGEFYF